MKTNWKVALMCIATLAFVACKQKNQPTPPTPGPGGGGEEPEFVSKISVTDNSIADWEKVPAAFLATATRPTEAVYMGLKSVKVYADELYINILAEYDEEDIPDHTSVPFHIYINTDNSDETGGYGDQWNDANVDIMMEGFFFSATAWDEEDNPLDDGAPCAYEPVIVPWTGEVGGTGWGWGDALTPAGTFVHSQHVGKCVEMQMLRELIPSLVGWNEKEFGIGFDIQQAWESVGILPLVNPTEENATGHTNKLQVKIDK